MRRISLLVLSAAVVAGSIAYLSWGNNTPVILDSQPEQMVAGKKVVCDQENLRERVACRLEKRKDNNALIMPEGCRGLESGELEKCLDKEDKTDKCDEKPVGTGRGSCAQQALGVTGSLQRSLVACGKITDELARKTCQREVREKAVALVLYRIDDLIHRVEASKVAPEKVVDFVTALEKYKVQFRAATTYAERKKILSDVRAAWKRFVTANKLSGMGNDYLGPAFTDLLVLK